MSRLASRIKRDAEFEENARHHRALAAELRERLAKTREGGSPGSRRRQPLALCEERYDRLEVVTPGGPQLDPRRSADG